MTFDNPTCFANHMGMWAIDVEFVRSTLSAIRDGTIVARDPSQMCMAVHYGAASEIVSTQAGGRYTRAENGLAAVRIDGPMMKGFSKFGGTSTIATRVALRAAMEDPKVKAVMMVTDTPGGSVAGTETLARAVADAGKIKPVAVFVDDLMASAGVWATAGATKIFAGPGSFIGSVGVMSLLTDTSGAMEKEGITVEAFTTGPYKAVGAPGVPQTDEHRSAIQERVDAMGARFFGAVRDGRNLTDEQMEEVATAKVFGAEDALRVGLIDQIATFEEAVAELMAPIEAKARRARAQSLVAKARRNP